DPVVVLTRVLTEDPPRPRSLEKSIPPAVEALIQRAMARAPDARPSTMQELDELLSAFDAPAQAEGAAVVSGGKARVSSGAALKDTVAMVPPPLREVDSVARRARRARPVAMVLTIAVSITTCAAVGTAALLAVRAATGRAA